MARQEDEGCGGQCSFLRVNYVAEYSGYDYFKAARSSEHLSFLRRLFVRPPDVHRSTVNTRTPPGPVLTVAVSDEPDVAREPRRESWSLGQRSLLTPCFVLLNTVFSSQ